MNGKCFLVPAFAGLMIAAHVFAQQPPSPLDALIKFDATTKEYTAKPGEMQAQFTFSLTNISAEPVVINSVTTSCGCTVAKLPSDPWTLLPGSNGDIFGAMNLAGKFGTVTKSVNINSDKGLKTLLVQSTIPSNPNTTTPVVGPPQMNREDAQKVAMTDRQSVFRGDCAACHVTPAKEKTGKDLYAAACGICHDAEHRASMVPDLHALKEPTNAEFWKNWISFGKPGSLMPAFAQSEGGPLTEAQITSLVEYLTTAIPSHPQPAAQQPKQKASAN